MKNNKVILSLLYCTLLLSACTKDQEENTTDPANPNETPSPQTSNSNQISSPNSPPSEIKTMRINQDLIILNENTEDSISSYPIYYENSKCVLKNITGKAKLKGGGSLG